MLNAIWVFFFLSAFVLALIKQWVLGEADVFAAIMAALFSQAKVAFEISLGLTGVLSLWLGIMRIGEKSGFIVLLTRVLTPLFTRLMPEIPKDHPAIGAIAFVSRDSDFWPAIIKAKRYGKETIVVLAEEASAAALKNTADQVVILKKNAE